jgi:recombination protein U
MVKGAGFESILAYMIARSSLSLIRKTDPPVKILRFDKSKGHFTGYFVSSGVLDFAGPYRGMHVEFDAKDTKRERFYFVMIKDHQWDRLRDLADDGSICGVIVRMRKNNADDDRIFGIPGRLLLEFKELGKKSLTVGEMEEFEEIVEIEYGKARGLINFVESQKMP